MKNLNARGLKILKCIHLLTVSLWMGGALSLLLAQSLAARLNADELAGILGALRHIDDLVIIPGAVGSLITGCIYGIWSHWGFFRHHWITVKWVATVGMILLGTFALGPWLNASEELVRLRRSEALANPELHSALRLNQIFGVIQFSLLSFLLVISVFKPFGRRGASKVRPQTQT